MTMSNRNETPESTDAQKNQLSSNLIVRLKISGKGELKGEVQRERCETKISNPGHSSVKS